MVYPALLIKVKEFLTRHGHKIKYHSQTSLSRTKCGLQKGYGNTKYYSKKSTDFLFGVPRTKPTWVRVEYSGVRKKFKHRRLRMFLRPFLGWFGLLISVNAFGITFYENPPLQPVKIVSVSTSTSLHVSPDGSFIGKTYVVDKTTTIVAGTILTFTGIAKSWLFSVKGGGATFQVMSSSSIVATSGDVFQDDFAPYPTNPTMTLNTLDSGATAQMIISGAR